MIRIKKSRRLPNLKVFKDKKFEIDGQKVTAAERETLRAIEWKENGGPKVNFSVYSKTEVKESLIKIFNEKCAYCETDVRKASKGDVEHFRPKGKIQTLDGDEISPGYYWLAADWNNLLFSCQNCNQKGRFRMDEDGDTVSMGKGIKFPLSDESKRVTSRVDDVSAENKFVLLINPCRTDPSKHLSFNDLGEISPSKSKSGKVSQKGELSIDVFGLHRIELVQGRRAKTIFIDRHIRKIYEKIKFIEDNPNLTDGQFDEQFGDLEFFVENVQNEFSAASEFIGAKRQKVQRLVEEFPALHEKFSDYGFPIDDWM